MASPEPTKAELLKIDSRGLRGTLGAELAEPTAKLSPAAETLIKFHGMYQQKNRDRRPAPAPGVTPLPPKPFTLMVRGRIPGGRLTWRQWLAWDEVADRYADNGLRITTRQSLQLHGVLKKDVKAAAQAIHRALSHTTGACGDVVRNVTQAPNPWGDPRLAQLDRPAATLSKHFEVASQAYFEIFLDGEAVAVEAEDPIYGRAYLPRKFKIGITAAGNNSIDIYTQDLGLAATYDAHGRLDGFFVLVGGGMGMSHSNPATKPRLADLLGWIPSPALLAVAEAVVTTQRDFGNRENRDFARLKYLIADRGLAWFKAEVERRAGVGFQERPLPPWHTPSYLGWWQRPDGTLALGFHTLSGRIVDSERRPLKSALRDLITAYQLDIQLTADQDLVLLGIKPSDKRAIEAHLDRFGLSIHPPGALFNKALTCVALPTCSKALAESERIGGAVFSALQDALDAHGLTGRAPAPVVRITGCPNGCARPYTAEIGIVGQMPGQYAVFLGGDAEGQRLAQKVKDRVKYEDLPAYLEKLAAYWRQHGEEDERLGDFVTRVGHQTISEAL